MRPPQLAYKRSVDVTIGTFRTRHDVRLESVLRFKADIGECNTGLFKGSETEPRPNGGGESGSVSGPLRATAVASHRAAKPPITMIIF